jgi:ABC-type multidrug transport system fused ATPase/permease subunit
MPFLVLQISFLVLDRASYALTEFFLAKWTEAEHVQVTFLGLAMPSQDEDGSALQWFLVYFCLFFSGMVFCFARTQWGYQGGIRAARSLYLAAQERVLFAPMAFFDTTPLGRLLNRFSYDTEVVDVTMTMKAAAALISVGWFLTGVAVMTAISKGVMLALLIPQGYAVYQLQLFYRRSAVDLQRIDAVSRSPLQSLLAEGLDGANTIRAFKMQSTFLLRLRAVRSKASASIQTPAHYNLFLFVLCHGRARRRWTPTPAPSCAGRARSGGWAFGWTSSRP